jgi:hypothetical protein
VIAVAQPTDSAKRWPDKPAGSSGRYEVVFLFARPTTAVPEREISLKPNFEGDSYIQLAENAPAGLRDFHQKTEASDGETIELDLRTNKQGFLASAHTRPFNAPDFQGAEDKAYRALAPTLSHWSAELDVPLQICRVFSTELATNSKRVSYQLPFAPLAFSPASVPSISDDLRFYLSLYREGLASNTAAYQFLCFYKIVEGLRLRRRRHDQEIVQSGGKPSRDPERIPENDADLSAWLNGLFRFEQLWDNHAIGWTVPTEARGKKVAQLFDTFFTDVRNNVAHALTEKLEPRHTADEQLNSRELYKWLPLVRCVARWMIKNDFPTEFLAGA